MRLIINADDFGLTSGVTYGIYDAMKRGVVTSTTMMVNTRATELAALLINNDDELNVGLHINLSLGSPLTDCPSLLNEGVFQKPTVWGTDDCFKAQELDREVEAQYQLFLELVGKKPTHIDSHLYIHQKFNKVRTSVIALAERHQLPVRQFATLKYNPVSFEGNFKVLPQENHDNMLQKFKDLVVGLKKCSIAELMVHPAFVDYDLLHGSSYNLQRLLEYSVLTDEKAKSFLQENQIELVSFKDCGS